MANNAISDPKVIKEWCQRTNRTVFIVNLILAGRYNCKSADFEARVILLCKDASNLELLSN